MRSVFWKVAALLAGVQVSVVLLAVVLAGVFAAGQSLDLVAGSLRVQLDQLAQEVEGRGGDLREGLADLPDRLLNDLTVRFPDPVTLVAPDGEPLLVVEPDAAAFEAVSAPADALPPGLADSLAQGGLVVQTDAAAPGGRYMLAPVYDADGLLAGGLLVQPLRASIARERAGPRRAFVRALAVVVVLATLVAILVGAFLTSRLVRPLRRITQRVEAIGAGDYASRIPVESADELGRLAAAVNQMAAAVEASVARLRATDQIRRELIANVGHDLRTPLAAMNGYAEEAERHLQAGDAAAAEEALRTARRQGRYLRRLVEDLFELSLLDSAAPPLRHEPIPLKELLADAARAHRAALRDAGIAFEVDLPDLPTIQGDGVRLLRVIDNLLANARHHTPAGGAVRLSARTGPGAVEVEVSDTGPGMTPAVLERAFDRYYRGEEARTRRSGGTGLGLPIARAIARAHGGDLTATSTPGAGSTFTLRLPTPH